jgi:NAD(P)-dependent dehydrogenase (short-subunit alcohol dehydrogenase family)
MGRATALMFAGEGALVVGCDVTAGPAATTVDMVRTAGNEMVSLHPCDLGDPPSARGLSSWR